MKIILVLFLLILFSFSVFGQTEQSVEKLVVLPDQTMRQVVRRVLIYSFKPRNKPTVIYLTEQGIKQAWLPKIEGIEFRRLSDSEIAGRDDLYFFTQLDRMSPNKYSVEFAYGNPVCYSKGSSWFFRISKQKVKLWLPDVGFGGGCAVS